jgi:quercetin dioxygenase-like cupin family protein
MQATSARTPAYVEPAELLPAEPRRLSTSLRDTTSTATGSDANVAGVAWSLSPRHRDLDSNIIRLRAGTGIEPHDGPDLDVLILALAGTGRIVTETDPLELRPGILVWLPRRSRRGFVAGPEGLSYLTVHRRRQALVLDPPSAASRWTLHHER